jgi:hypothetical protein
VAVTGEWVIAAPRAAVYAIMGDFEAMPRHFPQVAREMRLLERDGQHLRLEAIAGSFSRFTPTVRIALDVELLPGEGYRCRTHNLTFNTTGDEELRLFDHPEGTRIAYTYFVTVRRRALRPLFAWLVRTFGLPFWERSVIGALRRILRDEAHHR